MPSVGSFARRPRFPLGLSSLADASAQIKTGPLVPEDEVTAEDLARVETSLVDFLLDQETLSTDRTVAGVAIFLSDAVHDHRSERRAVDAIGVDSPIIRRRKA